jgi:hypothetical protein
VREATGASWEILMLQAQLSFFGPWPISLYSTFFHHLIHPFTLRPASATTAGGFSLVTLNVTPLKTARMRT